MIINCWRNPNGNCRVKWENIYMRVISAYGAYYSVFMIKFQKQMTIEV